MTKTYRVSKEIPKGYVYCVSMDFLEQLIKNGYLEEVEEREMLENVIFNTMITVLPSGEMPRVANAQTIARLAKAHVKEAVEKEWEKPGLMSKADFLKAIEEC